jgi:RNA polymerase sigma factor (sigma-70 family)
MAATATPARGDALGDSYERCMESMLEKARAWFPTLEGLESDLYQAAWESVLRNRERIVDLERYLESALYSAGLEQLRSRRRRRWVPLELVRLGNGPARRRGGVLGPDGLVDRTDPLPEEQIEMREDAQLVEEILSELPPRQQIIVKARWGWGLPRKEIAALLGISERVLKRELLEVAPRISEQAEYLRTGGWCERRRSLIVAYSFELLSARRSASARQHLSRCPGCRTMARELRRRLEELGAAVPLPPLAAHPSSHALFERAGELVDSGRNAMFDLAAGAKHHVLALFTRTPAGETAAGQLAAGGGLRGSGSAVAALAACVVAGGGATYCAVEGVPSAVRDVAGIEQTREPQHEKASTTPNQTPTAQTPTTAVPVTAPPQPDDAPAAKPQAEPKPQQTEGEFAPASPAPPGSKEFGSAPVARTARAPAPAPRTGGGEFTP